MSITESPEVTACRATRGNKPHLIVGLMESGEPWWREFEAELFRLGWRVHNHPTSNTRSFTRPERRL